MIKIKSYNRIWNVEGTLFAVGDVNLPFPVTFSQVVYFVVTFMIMISLSKVYPFSALGPLISNLGIPIALTILLNKIDFHGKKPPDFFLSYFLYLLRPKLTFRGKMILNKKMYKMNNEITVVRSVVFNDFSD